MSVYKELLYGIKEVEKRSHRIYPDAADFGVPLKDVRDPLVKMIIGLKELYGGKTETEHYATGATQTTTIIGLDEWNTGKEFIVKFVWVTTRSDRKRTGTIGYLYVEVTEPK